MVYRHSPPPRGPHSVIAAAMSYQPHPPAPPPQRVRRLSKTKWSRADYEYVSQAIRRARASLGEQLCDKTANEITWNLAKMFQKDSPKRFEELKFIAACTESV